MQTLQIKIKSQANLEYPIFVGDSLLPKIATLINLSKYSKVFVITIPIVEKYYFDKVLKAINFPVKKIVIKIDESTKDINSVKTIWRKLLENDCDRKSLIIILGGGVLGDVAGFAASTFARGVAFLHIPTTLLSQVDSSVGGKNGANFGGVKNLIGTFDQQVAVICDINLLFTLPDRQFIEGFGEIIKHGIVADKTYFDFVTSKKPREFSDDELSGIILGSVRIKAKIVNEDEKEGGIRKLINFGHTVGHAIEALSLNTNKPILHGEAVSIGMVVEAKISQLLGKISESEYKQVRNVLINAGLPTTIPNFPINKILDKIKSDKKSEAGQVNWTLLEKIGQGVINQKVDEKIVTSALKQSYESTD